ncbi:MAG: hypothetical protein QM765_22090 [Myxococcales bacterium]
MVSHSRTLALVCLACLAGCGQAAQGAALVHGELFSGRQPWQTSLEFTGTVVVHGALPFRIAVERQPAQDPRTGRDGRPSGLTIEIRNNILIRPGLPVPVGQVDVEGPQAVVRWVPPGNAAPSQVNDGNDLRYSDGGFEVHATGGFVQIDYTAKAPGDAVHGRFELTFQTGETVRGTFASTFAD